MRGVYTQKFFHQKGLKLSFFRKFSNAGQGLRSRTHCLWQLEALSPDHQ